MHNFAFFARFICDRCHREQRWPVFTRPEDRVDDAFRADALVSAKSIHSAECDG